RRRGPGPRAGGRAVAGSRGLPARAGQHRTRLGGKIGDRGTCCRLTRTTLEEEETMNQIVVNEPNRWRLETPGAAWLRSPRPNAANKYFMVSADGHANEPANLWVERIDAKYRERLPRIITDKDGVQWRVSEGHRPDRLRLSSLEDEDLARSKAGA